MAVEYSYYKTDCSAGYPRYYGINVVDGNEVQTEINQSDMLAAGQAIGCNPHASTGYGKKPPVTGNGLAAKTQRFGELLKAPQSTIDALKALAWYRGTMLMELVNRGIPIANPNNMFEIITKYGEVHPQLKSPTGKQKAVAMQPKSGGAGFDFGGLFGLVGDLVNGIADGIQNGNVAAFLTTWATEFQKYMTADFGSIQATLNATQAAPGAWGGWGPKGALDMLQQFKRTSWADLRNTITTYCTQHNVEIPAGVKELWRQQDMLEADLQAKVNAANPIEVGGGNHPNTGDTTAAGSWISKNIIWVILAVVALILLIVVFMAMSKRGKKAAK